MRSSGTNSANMDWASERVLARSDGLKVSRIHTGAITADMIDDKAVSDRAFEQDVRDAVRVRPGTVKQEPRVAVWIGVANP